MGCIEGCRRRLPVMARSGTPSIGVKPKPGVDVAMVTEPLEVATAAEGVLERDIHSGMPSMGVPAERKCGWKEDDEPSWSPTAAAVACMGDGCSKLAAAGDGGAGGDGGTGGAGMGRVSWSVMLRSCVDRPEPCLLPR